MRIGRLRHQVEVRARILSPDGAGGAAPSWTTLETLWAGVSHLAATRVADGALAPRRRRIAATLRYRNAVRLGRRLRFAGEDYDIVSVETTGGGRDRFMIALCEEAAQ